MRTGLLKKQLEEYYEKLTLKVSSTLINGSSYKVIDNWKEIATVFYELNKYKFIGESVNNIFEMGANYKAVTPNTVIYSSKYNEFENLFYIVKAKCKAIIDLESNIIYDNDENYLYIKLPDSLSDLEGLNEIVKGLEISINKCPILSNSYEKLEFIGVESGSNWLVLAVMCREGLKGLKWVAEYIKTCNDIAIQGKTIRNMDIEYMISKLKLKKEEEEEKIREIRKGIEDDCKKVCLEEFKKIKFDEKNITPSPEDEGKITHAMMTMIDLIEKGVEIYPSINASEEIKNSFPKKENWKLQETEKKMIEEKNDINEE